MNTREKEPVKPAPEGNILDHYDDIIIDAETLFETDRILVRAVTNAVQVYNPYELMYADRVLSEFDDPCIPFFKNAGVYLKGTEAVREFEKEFRTHFYKRATNAIGNPHITLDGIALLSQLNAEKRAGRKIRLHLVSMTDGSHMREKLVKGCFADLFASMHFGVDDKGGEIARIRATTKDPNRCVVMSNLPGHTALAHRHGIRSIGVCRAEHRNLDKFNDAAPDYLIKKMQGVLNLKRFTSTETPKRNPAELGGYNAR